MTTPAETASEWLRDMQKQFNEQIHAFGLRLATWLLVGNAAALVFIFKAILDGTACSEALLRTSIWCFTIGVMAAFAGSASTYLSSVYSIRILGRVVSIINDVSIKEYYADQLESEGIPIPDDSTLNIDTDGVQSELNTLNVRLQGLWRVYWLTVALYAFSGASFAAGVILPVSKADLSFRSCESAPQAPSPR